MNDKPSSGQKINITDQNVEDRNAVDTLSAQARQTRSALMVTAFFLLMFSYAVQPLHCGVVSLRGYGGGVVTITDNWAHSILLLLVVYFTASFTTAAFYDQLRPLNDRLRQDLLKDFRAAKSEVTRYIVKQTHTTLAEADVALDAIEKATNMKNSFGLSGTLEKHLKNIRNQNFLDKEDIKMLPLDKINKMIELLEQPSPVQKFAGIMQVQAFNKYLPIIFGVAAITFASLKLPIGVPKTSLKVEFQHELNRDYSADQECKAQPIDVAFASSSFSSP